MSIVKNLSHALELPSDRMPSAGDIARAVEIIATKNFNNIKYTLAGLPQVAQALARFAWSLTSYQGRLTSFDAIAGMPTKLGQLYHVWNRLSTQEQKDLFAQKVADLLLVAPSEVGMWVYGGKVLNVAGRSAAGVARAGVKAVNPLWAGVMAGIGRFRTNALAPFAQSIRSSRVRFRGSHLQDGYVQFGSKLNQTKYLKIVKDSSELRSFSTATAKLKVTKYTVKRLINAETPLTACERIWQETESFYGKIRGSMSDVIAISQNTKIDQALIVRIKNHLFNNLHNLRGRLQRFAPDEDIAAAWKRLIDGKFYEVDLKLLEHELAEAIIMEDFHLLYEDAHEMANIISNWNNSF